MSFVLAKLFLAPERPGVNVQGCSMSMMCHRCESLTDLEQTFNLVSNLVSLRLLSLLLLGSRQLLGGTRRTWLSCHRNVLSVLDESNEIRDCIKCFLASLHPDNFAASILLLFDLNFTLMLPLCGISEVVTFLL